MEIAITRGVSAPYLIEPVKLVAPANEQRVGWELLHCRDRDVVQLDRVGHGGQAAGAGADWDVGTLSGTGWS